MRKRGTHKLYVYTVPSKKAIQSVKDKVRDKTSRSTLHMSLAELLRSLARAAGVGELLPAWGVQGRVQRDRLAHVEPDRDLDTPQAQPHRLETAPAQVLRPGLAVRRPGNRVHRRLQRRRDPLPLPRQMNSLLDKSCTSRQVAYDLRHLRGLRIIKRLPHTTATGSPTSDAASRCWSPRPAGGYSPPTWSDSILHCPATQPNTAPRHRPATTEPRTRRHIDNGLAAAWKAQFDPIRTSYSYRPR
jgi:hypothetical protein